MSLLLRTLKAFPRGCTLEELFVLLDSAFDSGKRRAIQVELDELVIAGEVRKLRNGKWQPIVRPVVNNREKVIGINQIKESADIDSVEDNALIAAYASFHRQAVNTNSDLEKDEEEQPDPNALLRYWRSALRSDPRGAITQAEDRHGSAWHLVTGAGPIFPEEGQQQNLLIELDLLSPEFRQALMRRDSNENVFAIGWPIAIGRKSGAPAIWPVGLLSAEWKRTDSQLDIVIEADDILVNPDWLKGAARSTGWTEKGLKEVFADSGSVGLRSTEFIPRLREAAAGHMRGRITGEGLLSQIEPHVTGIYDIAAIFLPSDSSFTAGAVRDLDAIASWSEERLARTALAPLLGLASTIETIEIHDVNLGATNAEQLAAIRNACTAPLSLVTGPPGTGKSQAIMSMATSVLISGGSVLIASKNHQALDAVEDRLAALAASAPLLIRTLDPAREIDCSIADVLADLISNPSGFVTEVNEMVKDKLITLSKKRCRALDSMRRIEEIECEIADLLERINVRQKNNNPEVVFPEHLTNNSRGVWGRCWCWFYRLVARRGCNKTEGMLLDEAARQEGASIHTLNARLKELRAEKRLMDEPDDPITLSESISRLVEEHLPEFLAMRSYVSEESRLVMAETKDNLHFAEPNAPLPGDLARSVISHRPLWLASILGTPKRIPLDDGLFDLVIFDEASQCDIASALPLFARAKRAVVVGDDRQLSFIAQLGQAQDRNLMQAQGLPVSRMGRFAQSRHSLFDFTLRVPHVPRVLLRQQYRSAGPIVDYISGEFYGGRLATAYDPKKLNVPKSQKSGIAWTHVESPLMTEGNVNHKEADAVAEHLKLLLVEEGYQGTVGVIAPFRAQVHTVEERIHSLIPEQKLIGAELRVATVDGFQGQERDVILFSPCLGASSSASAITFLQRDYRRFNVAISRARAVAHIFGDLSFARSGKVRVLARLAAAATEPKKKSGEGVFDSEWERRVYHALKEHGFEPVPQYEIAGRRLDFALFGAKGIKLDLEVDGRRWHQDAEGKRKISDHWRDHQLKSLGWRVRRFWVDELAQDMEACLELVKQDLS